MPRVRPLAREDPMKTRIRGEIFAMLGVLGIDRRTLAQKAGLSASTLSRRIGKGGNIGDLTLDEYLAIKKAAKLLGYEEQGN